MKGDVKGTRKLKPKEERLSSRRTLGDVEEWDALSLLPVIWGKDCELIQPGNVAEL